MRIRKKANPAKATKYLYLPWKSSILWVFNSIMIYPRSLVFIPLPYWGKNKKEIFLRRKKRMGAIRPVRNDCGA
jgi:hypothetical protein